MAVSPSRFLAAVALFSVLVAQVPAADPPMAKDKDLVAAVRKAAETAEVHGVGVAYARHYRFDGVTEYSSLLKQLRDKDKKAAVLWVWQNLSEDTQKKVLDDKYFAQVEKTDPAGFGIELRGAVSGGLRTIIDNPDFYSEEVFSKSFLLTEEVKKLVALGKKRSVSETARLNWLLLEKTFPFSIPEMPKHFRTVRVQVVQGSDVILVLSSSGVCRWEVKLLEGAKVTGVILCGYQGQEIVGVDAPVVYRAYYASDNVTVVHPDDFLRGYKPESREYKELVAGIKKITGKEFTSFATPSEKGGVFGPNDEPFTIRPKGK